MDNKIKISFLLALLSFTQLCSSQILRTKNWHFGYNTSLIFEKDTVILDTSAIHSDESCTSISDINGNLLLYSDGITVWNKNHKIICSHEHHRQHHIANAHERYCTSFSINNYILDNIYFWRILEMIIGIFGVKPNRKPVYEHYEPIHNYMHTDAKNECPKRPTDMDKKILIKNLENHIKCY